LLGLDGIKNPKFKFSKKAFEEEEKAYFNPDCYDDEDDKFIGVGENEFADELVRDIIGKNYRDFASENNIPDIPLHNDDGGGGEYINYNFNEDVDYNY